jgi:hypothetical protein
MSLDPELIAITRVSLLAALLAPFLAALVTVQLYHMAGDATIALSIAVVL